MSWARSFESPVTRHVSSGRESCFKSQVPAMKASNPMASLDGIKQKTNKTLSFPSRQFPRVCHLPWIFSLLSVNKFPYFSFTFFLFLLFLSVPFMFPSVCLLSLPSPFYPLPPTILLCLLWYRLRSSVTLSMPVYSRLDCHEGYHGGLWRDPEEVAAVNTNCYCPCSHSKAIS